MDADRAGITAGSYGGYASMWSASALLKWIKLLKSEKAERQRKIIAELKSYCHPDIFGMVKLLEHVRSVIQGRGRTNSWSNIGSIRQAIAIVPFVKFL